MFEEKNLGCDEKDFDPYNMTIDTELSMVGSYVGIARDKLFFMISKEMADVVSHQVNLLEFEKRRPPLYNGRLKLTAGDNNMLKLRNKPINSQFMITIKIQETHDSYEFICVRIEN